MTDKIDVYDSFDWASKSVSHGRLCSAWKGIQSWMSKLFQSERFPELSLEILEFCKEPNNASLSPKVHQAWHKETSGLWPLSCCTPLASRFSPSEKLKHTPLKPCSQMQKQPGHKVMMRQLWWVTWQTKRHALGQANREGGHVQMKAELYVMCWLACRLVDLGLVEQTKQTKYFLQCY